MSQTSSTYELSYIPTTRGRNELAVQINNTEVGTFQVFVQHPPTQLGTPVRTINLGVKPYYIAVGDKGELFVTQIFDYRYTVLDAQGQRVQTIGSKGKPPFGDRGPTGIATDGEGNVYVASMLSAPHGLCVSGDYVYVTEEEGNWLAKKSSYGWNSVSVFHTSGEFVHSFWKWASECMCDSVTTSE